MPVAYGLTDPVDLALPHLPLECEGLRIAHLTDMHIARPLLRWLGLGPRRGRPDRLARLTNQLRALKIDLIFLTGDYMDKLGDEEIAIEGMRDLCRQLHPRIGSFGVFGNHDLPHFRDAVTEIPNVRWLHNESERLPDLPVELFGLDEARDERPDVVELLLQREPDPPGPRPLRLLLTHSSSTLTTAADLAVDAMFCGHTHGGQIRLPGNRALTNASDLPLDLTSGLLRHRNTLCAVSRGLGETGFPRMRLFCRPHAPVYTLRRRSLPGRYTDHIEMLRAW